ncbi:MAG: hypothetical protein JEZ14_11355 [Marinilabiliaceae bacterium]|nr:hypothetical protein [Marinilabiliaceae bacterium]
MKREIKKTEELHTAMCDVRNAFRLLKEYQERMLNIVSYIKNRYAMPELAGRRHFCDKLRGKKNGYAEIQIWKDMWTWDFLYGYEFEYYLGSNELKDIKKKGKYAMSIIQVSDTGFHESSDANKDPNQIETFKDSENSSSLLLFIFEWVKDDKDWLWDDSAAIFDKVKKELLERQKPTMERITKDNCFISARYSIDRFLEQSSCDEVLNEFDELVFNKCEVRLRKK